MEQHSIISIFTHDAMTNYYYVTKRAKSFVVYCVVNVHIQVVYLLIIYRLW